MDAGTSLPQAGGYRNVAVLLSYLGRLNYTYDDKYLLTATFRRDASSRVKKRTAGVISRLYLLHGESVKRDFCSGEMGR